MTSYRVNMLWTGYTSLLLPAGALKNRNQHHLTQFLAVLIYENWILMAIEDPYTCSLSSSCQSYSRDLFLFLYALLIIASALTSLKKHHDKSSFSGKSILYLNRHQTEEWKGWMQVSILQLDYHLLSVFDIFPISHILCLYISKLFVKVCCQYTFTQGLMRNLILFLFSYSIITGGILLCCVGSNSLAHFDFMLYWW